MTIAMIRVALTYAVISLLLLVGESTTRADGIDSLINLELAFRDEILDAPAPTYFQRLIREGETTITFVDSLPDSIGKTDFFLSLDWSYEYQYRTQPVGEITTVTVTPVNVKPKSSLRHVIQMPVALYHASVWDSKLLSHEFDHVAVSLDPRPRALLFHLCSKLPTYQFSMNGSGKPSDKRIRERINREITSRQTAVLDLIRANYVALDDVSKHGRVAMEKRQAFFENLYTSPNLESAAFPFQAEATAFLQSEQYQRLRPRNAPADPATRGTR